MRTKRKFDSMRPVDNEAAYIDQVPCHDVVALANDYCSDSKTSPPITTSIQHFSVVSPLTVP